MDSWAVYILECADGTLYTGIARDLSRRLRQSLPANAASAVEKGKELLGL